MFTYYTIAGKNPDILRKHLDPIKREILDYPSAESKILVIVYKNPSISPDVTQEIIDYCTKEGIDTYVHTENKGSFIENLYDCWNLGYEKAETKFVFRGGSDQLWCPGSFTSIYDAALKLAEDHEEFVLQSNTIENKRKLEQIGARSRHIVLDLGTSYNDFKEGEFLEICSTMKQMTDEPIMNINQSLRVYGHPIAFPTSLGIINRPDGCSWLQTKAMWEKYGPLPVMEKGFTGDVIIHDRYQLAGVPAFLVRDSITYHLVQGGG